VKQGCFLLAESGRPLWPDVRVMEGWLERYYGLKKYPNMPSNRALWLPNCNAIHSFGMAMAIDVIGLNAGFQIISVRRNLRPQVMLRIPQATSIIECEAGVALPLEHWLGKQLRFIQKDHCNVAF
jgi:uncharacterized membrane protein (UPF0127 family)